MTKSGSIGTSSVPGRLIRRAGAAWRTVVQDLLGGGHAFFEVSVSEHFAMAFVTFF